MNETPEIPSVSRLSASVAGGAEQISQAQEKILAAALQQLEDFGFRRFTIDDVAKRAGCSRVTIYRHFVNKDQLVEAVLLRELGSFTSEIETIMAPHQTLTDKTIEAFVFGLTYLRNHDLLNRLLRTEPELILPILTTEASPVLAAGREFVAAQLSSSAVAGVTNQDDDRLQIASELMGRMMLSLILTPETVMGLQDENEIRRFAEAYLRPGFELLTSMLPQPTPLLHSVKY